MPTTDFTKAFPPVEREIWVVNDGTWCLDDGPMWNCPCHRDYMLPSKEEREVALAEIQRLGQEIEADGWETLYVTERGKRHLTSDGQAVMDRALKRSVTKVSPPGLAIDPTEWKRI